MYRVFITDEMIEDSKKYSKALKDEGIDENLKQMTLRPVNKHLNLKPYEDYIQAIADKYESILQLLPSQFDSEQTNFSQYAVNLEELFYTRQRKKVPFHKIIVSYMRYSTSARKKILPYLHNYGFSTCVYCNAMEGDIDHHYDKATYPFLCTSFFNLVPCCPFCNRPGKKGNRKIKFSPYRELEQNEEANPFEFVFDIPDVGKNCSNKDDIKFEFNEKEWMGDKILYGLETSKKSYKDIFKIESCYEKKKKFVQDVLNDNRFQNYWQEKTARAVSNNRLEAEPEEEKKINILRVYSLKYEDVHRRELMKFLLDLGKYLEMVP